MNINEIDWERFKNPDPNNLNVTFAENGKHYVFSHSREGCEWHLAELSGDMPSFRSLTDGCADDLMPKELRRGRWQRYYEVLIPFIEHGKNYLFAHSSRDNRWFISDLSAAWDGDAEKKSGRWARFYASAVTFIEGGRNYLFAHSDTDKRWFISELSSGWNGDTEVSNGRWYRFYGSHLAFVRDGRNYIFGHAVQDNKWYISELTTGWDGNSTLKTGTSPLSSMVSLPRF